MTEILDIVSARRDGLITYAALRERGLNSHTVDSLIRGGTLVRTRRGIYVPGELWRASDPDQRYPTCQGELRPVPQSKSAV